MFISAWSLLNGGKLWNAIQRMPPRRWETSAFQPHFHAKLEREVGPLYCTFTSLMLLTRASYTLCSSALHFWMRVVQEGAGYLQHPTTFPLLAQDLLKVRTSSCEIQRSVKNLLKRKLRLDCYRSKATRQNWLKPSTLNLTVRPRFSRLMNQSSSWMPDKGKMSHFPLTRYHPLIPKCL